MKIQQNKIIVSAVITSMITLILLSNAGAKEAPERFPASVTADGKLVQTLVENGLYFSAIPIVRKNLRKSRLNNQLNDALVKIVEEIGSEQFEQIDFNNLRSRKRKIVHYLHSKKLMKQGKFTTALGKLEKSFLSDSSLYSHQLLLAASAASLAGKKDLSTKYFKDCLGQLKGNVSYGKIESLFEQETRVIHDTCLVGLSRNEFEAKNFDSAYLNYLDLDKSSPIWPEILFEEAWTSFYQGNFNRALGKLVTYRSPFLSFIFNPEVDVLNALTFMELCYWDDAKKIVDDFYKQYGRDAKFLEKFLEKYQNKISKLGALALKVTDENNLRNPLLFKLFNSLSRDIAFKRYKQNYLNLKQELSLIKRYPSAQLRPRLANNLKIAARSQKAAMGQYVRRILRRQNRILRKSFQGMSYIKLEILANVKKRFFGVKVNENGKIGALKNLERTQKQYLWDFVGEFWADELGDYVYSLKSACK